MPLTKILITGGSGLVGTRLTHFLEDKAYEIAYMSRDPSKTVKRSFKWDIEHEKIDTEALEWADGVVHLAGASISGGLWTAKRKKILRESRIKSLNMILKGYQAIGQHPEVLVSSSGINYYGYDSGSVWKHEGSRFGDDFLATLTKEWEAAARQFEELGSRVVSIRSGLVLSKKGGALPLMALPVKLGVGAALGSGDQYLSWIHIDDICGIYQKAVEDSKMQGVYNGVAPEPVTNKEFMRSIARVLGRPFFMPNVPRWALKLIFGEMASTVLGSCRASSKRIEEAGYTFKYENLKDTLEAEYRKKN